MNEILLLIDFNYPHIHQLALNLRQLGVYTEIISHIDTIPFSDEIKGIIFVGESLFTSFNIDSLEIPILAIQSGSWSLASSFNITLSDDNSTESLISQNWISSQYSDHPLLVGLKSGSTIPLKRIRNLIGKNFISLCQNNLGITTIFQITGKQFYGLQFCPNDNSPIWRNFLHLCGISYNWKITSILNTLKIQLETLLQNTESTSNIILPYSGGVKSTILAVLLFNLNKNIVLRLVNTGFFRLNEIESSINTMKGLGIHVEILENDCSSRDRSGDLAFHNPSKISSTVITQTFKNGPLIIPTLLTESNNTLHWKIKFYQPFKHLYREELLSIGDLLGLSPSILKQHPFPPSGLAEKLDISHISSIDKLRLIDWQWTQYLINHNYYYQIYRSSVIPISSNNIFGLSAIDKNGHTLPLPTEFLLNFKKLIPDTELVYCLI